MPWFWMPHDQCTEITTFSWSHPITLTLRLSDMEPMMGGLVPAWLGGGWIEEVGVLCSQGPPWVVDLPTEKACNIVFPHDS